MKITVEWLEKEKACKSGIDWFKEKKKTDLVDVINLLMKEDHFGWANWTIVRFMDHPQKIQYAIFAAESVIKIFEKKYPNDDRPRKAIEAAKEYLKNPSTENKKAAAYAAAYAAYAAAYAAADAADAAAYAAADAAAYAAADAAYAAYAAAYAAYAKKKLQKKIIKNGLKILEGK